jgi:hypothetical protein
MTKSHSNELFAHSNEMFSNVETMKKGAGLAMQLKIMPHTQAGQSIRRSSNRQNLSS